jgi:uncharacterized protein
MTKILFFVAVALLVYLAVRSRRSAARKSDTGSPQAPAGGEAIVACCRCGVHVPVSESVEVDGRRYCCPEHGRLG